MKKYVFLFVLSLLFACADNVSPGSRQKQGTGELSASEQLIVQTLKDFFKPVLETSRSEEGAESGTFSFFRNIDAYALSSLPYYVFDSEKFYENPSPEMLACCLRPSTSEKWFMGVATDSVFFSAVEQDSTWRMRSFIQQWGKLVSWLPAKLQEANTDDYKLFKLGYNIYVSFNRNGHDVYYPITGLYELSEEKFCELAMLQIKREKSFPLRQSSRLSDEEKVRLSNKMENLFEQKR